MNKSELISSFLKKNYLISPDFFENFNGEGLDSTSMDHIFGKDKPTVLDKNLLFLIKNKLSIDINWKDFEQSKVVFEKGKDERIYKTFLDILYYTTSDQNKKKMDTILETVTHQHPIDKSVDEKEEDYSSVVVLESYKEETKKREVQDFVTYFRLRYDALKKILQGRRELQNVISVSRALNKTGRDNIVLIGLIYDKRITKNGNIMVTLEDTTGKVNLIINKNRGDLYTQAKNLVFDEVIGIEGMFANGLVFVNNLFFPDIPINKELKVADEEVYAVFTADMHVGSNMFFEEDFTKFIDWLNGQYGDKEQKKIASKVKYLFVVGDLVDGVGIYPNQDKELFITDIYEQYEKCTEFFDKIRKDLKIIMCPGNHDASRISEPQPILDKEFAKSLWNLKNITFVPNPALVNIHASKNFGGFNILLYHGYSFPYFADAVEEIRLNGGLDRSDLIMKFLLQKRHLAPTHASSLYIPNTLEDPLVIKTIPDFFVTAHIHRTSVMNYNNVTLIGCGCWQGQTPFMEKVGIHPDPSRVSIVNLKTREIKILKFGK